MAQSIDLTSYDSALKEYYTGAMIEDLIGKDNPFLALVSKSEKFPGRNLRIVVKFKHGGGRSSSFSVAQANSANGVGLEDFVLTRVKDYFISTVDGETIESTKDDAGAFMDAMTVAGDSAIGALTNTLARDLFRSGWGSIGTIAAGGISGYTITLSDPNDSVNFNLGDINVFALTESTSTLRNSGAGLIVSGVNRSTGVITYSAAISTETSTANGDTIFVKGDRQNSATPVRLKVAGVGAWCPAVAPAASENFFSVDRSVDSRLAGLFYAPASGTQLDEALLEAAGMVHREGGRLTHFFMGTGRYTELVKLLQKNVQYVDVTVSAQVGFKGVSIMGPGGAITCIADRNVQSDRVFGVSMDSWKLHTIGKAVRLIDTDGSSAVRQAADDGIEIRWGFKGNLGCDAPIHNIQIALS